MDGDGNMRTKYKLRGDFIRKSLRVRGKNQSWLAEEIDTQSGHLGRWLNNNVEISMSKAVAIADALSMPVDILIERVSADGVAETHVIYGMDRARQIPNIGYIGAGNEVKSDLLFEGGHPKYEGILGYVNFPSGDPDAFILTVLGDSMEPVYPDGSYVLIEPHLGFRANHMHFVCDNNGGKYLKRVQWHGDHYILESFNAYKFPPIYRKPHEILNIDGLGPCLLRATWFKPKE
jgi:hypothetical protein